jgi:hypothetical protein
MADMPRAFAIDAAEGVVVYVDDSSDDETFDIAVHQEGAEVEKHEGVSAASIVSLESDRFSVEYIDAPASPAE